MLYAQFLATQERRGKAPVDKDVGRSIDRIYAEHFATVSLHQITPARAAAREDLRNHFSLYCVWKALTTLIGGRKLSPKLQANFDATNVVFFSDEQGRLVKLKTMKTKDLLHVISRKSNVKLPLCMKFLHLQTAACQIAPIIGIFADPDMEEGEYKVHEVKGFSPFNIPDQVGYIVFMKTRQSGGEKFWAWCFDKYIEFMIKV
jgi:hypothetical protein